MEYRMKAARGRLGFVADVRREDNPGLGQAAR
jgi:hypothetical protein